MNLPEYLQQMVTGWEAIGHPALLERFVLRNGKVYTPRKRIGRKRQAKMCYKNATDFVLHRNVGTYVEGLVIRKELPLAFHHAWVTITGDDAMDPTLPSHELQYMGIAFEQDVLRKEILKQGRYGVLDHGLGYNFELMFAIDPELKDIFEAIRRKGRETIHRQEGPKGTPGKFGGAFGETRGL